MSLPLLLPPHCLLACAACYGASDSPLAQGMNWGIVSLLATVLLVLGGVVAFFVSLARRAAALSRAPAPGAAASVPEGAVPASGPPRLARVRHPSPFTRHPSLVTRHFWISYDGKTAGFASRRLGKRPTC